MHREPLPLPAEPALRRGRATDAAAVGTIVHDAFKAIADAHAFPPDFPSPEAAIGLAEHMLAREDIHSVIAERDGRVVGSNFLWAGDEVAGVGPITVEPGAQNAGIGARLMQAVLNQANLRDKDAVRLVQAAYHTRSMSLYAKLGFVARAPLSLLQGPAIGRALPGIAVRDATAADVDAADALCRKVHSISRRNELIGAWRQGSVRVAERDGHITAYATDIAFFGHAVAERNDDLMALIAAAPAFGGPGFMVPTLNAELLRWCLDNGLRIVQPMTLMTLGPYREPRGAWLPSILY